MEGDADLGSFRSRAREWLGRNVPLLPPDASELGRLPGEAEQQFAARSRRLQRELYDAGFAGIAVPREFGGQGLTQAHELAFDDEAARHEKPGVFGGTFRVILPVLLEYFTDEQKRRHFPPIFSGDAFWVQLMSEPSAGSDLAAVRTDAARHGDTFVLNGQKVWTTAGQISDFGMCLARTNWDAPKHAGLTMFVVDLHAPGVTIRPLVRMTGEAGFNEIFLDDVEVSERDIIGQIDRGWDVVTSWLTFEHGGVSRGESRSGSGVSAPSPMEEAGRALIEHFRTSPSRSSVSRHQVVQAFIEEAIQAMLKERLAVAMRTGALPGPAGSLLKVGGAVKLQRRAALAMHLAGIGSVAWEGGGTPWLTWEFLQSRGMTIGAGTNEILWNGVGERVLGLPREPSVDTRIAFRQVPTGIGRERATPSSR